MSARIIPNHSDSRPADRAKRRANQRVDQRLLDQLRAEFRRNNPNRTERTIDIAVTAILSGGAELHHVCARCANDDVAATPYKTADNRIIWLCRACRRSLGKQRLRRLSRTEQLQEQIYSAIAFDRLWWQRPS